MARGRRFGVRWGLLLASSALAAVAIAPPASASSGGGELRKLYREDAFAEFEIHHGDCPLERTVIQVAFHQDFFHILPAPAPRNVVFGLSISEFDCGGQFLASYGSNEGEKRPFDVAPGLTGAAATATMQACQEFPAAGDCFPVDLRVAFKGVGRIDVDRQRTLIDEPDCYIDQRLVTMTRDAKVWATFSWTPPGGSPQSYQVTTADLSAAGANLFTDSENTFMRGDGFACTEH